MLSAELKQSLKRLRDEPVEYSEQHRGFVLNHSDNHREPKRGLTTVLHEVFPVPLGVRDDTDAPQKRARCSSADPQPQRELWRRAKCRTPSADTCKTATLHEHVDGLAPTFGAGGFGRDFAVRHGKLVDQQLTYIVKNGMLLVRATDMLVDPCAATLRDYFADSGLAMIASQVPLYSADLDVATALDVLCTDVATRSELHLCEIKSTTGDAGADDDYTRVRGRLRATAARGTPLSFYVGHQLQLGVMHEMIAATLGRPPTTSRLLRVSPNCVSVYRLTPWFAAKSQQLLPVIKRRAARGAKKRAKRKQKAQMLTK